jgi:hypothetical protein
MNHAVGAANLYIEHPHPNRPSEGETMSDQENRNPQHTDGQRPGSEQKSGSQPNQPAQQKQQNQSGQPKSPQPEQGRNDQEKKKPA